MKFQINTYQRAFSRNIVVYSLYTERNIVCYWGTENFPYIDNTFMKFAV